MSRMLQTAEGRREMKQGAAILSQGLCNINNASTQNHLKLFDQAAAFKEVQGSVSRVVLQN